MQQSQMTQTLNDDQRVITQPYENQPTAPTFNPGYVPNLHVVVESPEEIRHRNDIKMSRTSRGLGITRIVIGILCIIMQVIVIFEGPTSLSFIGEGIWCGIFFVVTGSVGLSAGCTRQRCQIVTHAVLAIVTASLFAPMVLIISCFDLAVSVGGYYITSATIAARSILLCLAFIEFVIDIIVSGFFCWLSCYSQPYGVVRNGGYPNMQQPRGNIIQIPTNRVGPMYIQAGVGQPMMYQLPTIREQAPHPHSN